jgi:hypothetical protein
MCDFLSSSSELDIPSMTPSEKLFLASSLASLNGFFPPELDSLLTSFLLDYLPVSVSNQQLVKIFNIVNRFKLGDSIDSISLANDISPARVFDIIRNFC